MNKWNIVHDGDNLVAQPQSLSYIYVFKQKLVYL